jgi:hypothetical protein
MVVVDFATGLKIDFNFECVVNREALACDLTASVIEKLNSFVDTYNEKSGVKVTTDDTRKASCDTNTSGGLFVSSLKSSVGYGGSSTQKYSHNNGAASGMIGSRVVSHLDDDPTLYYLCVYSNNSSDDTVRELTLPCDFQLATLKEALSNEKLYLKRKKFHTKFV